jgi:membrane-associated phospholipid phosphatase
MLASQAAIAVDCAALPPSCDFSSLAPLGEALWLTNVGKTTSFPSGHALQSLSTFLALALVAVFFLPRGRAGLLVVAGVLAAGVGWSRVYLGVHWATDVAAGWLFAGVWVAIVLWLVVGRPIEQRWCAARASQA